MFDHPQVMRQQGDIWLNILASPSAGLASQPHEINKDKWNRHKDSMLGKGPTSDWWGAPTGLIAEERMLKGWPEGVDKVRQTLSVLNIPSIPKRRKARYGLNGELEVDRVLFHDPEPFRYHNKTLAPLVKITVDIGGNGHTGANSLRWSGGCAVILSDMLEQAGFSTEIIGMAHCASMYERPGPPTELTMMKLKDAQAPLNISILAGTIFTAAGFRIAMWRSWHAAPFSIAYGYGHHINTPASVHGDIHIPDSIRTEAAAKKFLAELPTCRRTDLRDFLTHGGK